ncbi:hypothetical protein P40081_28170 [Paenibacillus sp. FSL P4-0081]|nr:hypothetical protein P40081_28170 [Paenibacillus sp. FSL P4-0081]
MLRIYHLILSDVMGNCVVFKLEQVQDSKVNSYSDCLDNHVNILVILFRAAFILLKMTCLILKMPI